MTTKLKLGPLPKVHPVKLTITLSVELKETLDRYAELHSEATGEKNKAERLIPYMLEAFIARDRAYRNARRAALGSGPRF